jgi:hypothetical protein
VVSRLNYGTLGLVSHAEPVLIGQPRSLPRPTPTRFVKLIFGEQLFVASLEL